MSSNHLQKQKKAGKPRLSTGQLWFLRKADRTWQVQETCGHKDTGSDLAKLVRNDHMRTPQDIEDISQRKIRSHFLV